MFVHAAAPHKKTVKSHTKAQTNQFPTFLQKGRPQAVTGIVTSQEEKDEEEV